MITLSFLCVLMMDTRADVVVQNSFWVIGGQGQGQVYVHMAVSWTCMTF